MSVLGSKDPAAKPCVNRCTTHLGGDVCRGCGRTVAEIRDWPTYTREQRIQINERIKSCRKKSPTSSPKP